MKGKTSRCLELVQANLLYHAGRRSVHLLQSGSLTTRYVYGGESCVSAMQVESLARLTESAVPTGRLMRQISVFGHDGNARSKCRGKLYRVDTS